MQGIWIVHVVASELIRIGLNALAPKSSDEYILLRTLDLNLRAVHDDSLFAFGLHSLCFINFVISSLVR